MPNGTAIALSTTLLLASAAHAAPQTINRSKTISLADDQVTDNTFTNDIWWSPLIDFQRVQLANGDTCIFTLNFTQGHLVDLTSSAITNDESIHILVDGGPATGGDPNNIADWKVDFMGATDPDFSATSFTGTDTFGPLTGTLSVTHNADYLQGNGTVSGLKLTLVNKNPNGWSFSQVRLGLDAAAVQVTKPAPTPGTLALLGMGGLAAARRRRV